MFDAGTAIVASSLISGGLSYLGSQSAADATENAADKSAETALEMYNQTREDLSGYRDIGGKATTSISDLLGYNGEAAQKSAFAAYQADPSYQFMLDQGTQAIERSAAAKGGLFSGNTGISLQNYGQNMANASYSDYYNRLAGLASMGQNAAGQTGSAGSSAASSASQAYSSTANSSDAGFYSDLSNILNKGIQNYMTYSLKK